MFLRITSIAARILGAIAVLIAINTANAEELPDGVKVNLIAEYLSRVPTIEKVRYVKVVFQPGAKFDKVVVKHEEYCRLSQGQLTHTNHETGITDVFTVGSLWSPPKGDHHTVTNTGDDIAIMWVYQLIEKGATRGGKM